MYITGFFVLSLFVVGVPAPPGHPGQSVLCRSCHNVKDPRDCKVYERCGHEGQCSTVVHSLNNAYSFTYSCKPHHECEHQVDILGKRERGHPHEHGQLVCHSCCATSGCDSDSCSKYFSRTTTPQPTTATTTTTTAATTTTADNGCRDYESATFQCAELDKYNFCTDTASVGYAIAHEKCAKHCGLCSQYGTTAPGTVPSTVASTQPSATTTMSADFSTTTVYAETPIVVQVNVTVSALDGSSDCADNDDPSLTCTDMQTFGFCAPDSGAGYTFAQLRCKKTCDFC